MKILVSHLHRLVRDSISCIISREQGIQVVSTCKPDEIVSQATHLQPGIVVFGGIRIDPDGIEVINAVKESVSSVSFLVISKTPSSEELMGILQAGASAYLTYDSSSLALIDAIRKVIAGEVVLDGIGKRALQTERDSNGYVTNAVSHLTPREKEVLRLLSQGFSNRQIANSLYISEHTVRTHIQNLRSKLNVRSKFEAAMVAIRSTDSRLEFERSFKL